MTSIFGDGVEIEFFEDAHEPNDLQGEAVPIAVDGVALHSTFFVDPELDGSGGSVNDADWFSFDALQDYPYEIETLNLWSAADTRILRCATVSARRWTTNNDRAAGDPSSFISWTAPADGTYYIEVTQPNDFTPYGSYDLRVVPPADSDGDGTIDALDVCPAIADPGQEDGDSDGIGDACDNCPVDPNGGQQDADGDGAGDACDVCPDDADDDGDADGLCADVDNCPVDSNPGQEDEDIDGVGDACDDRASETRPTTWTRTACAGPWTTAPTTPNPGQIDSDADGPGDACDVCPNDPTQRRGRRRRVR